jgi:single-strand DNA-binding protein
LEADVFNQIIIIGNVGNPPEIRRVNGKTYASLSVATTEKWTGADGVKNERTQWHRVNFFERQAEIVEQYVFKGSRIQVVGKMTYEEYETNGVKKQAAKIMAQQLLLLTPKQDNADGAPVNEPYQAQPQRQAPDFAADLDDDIPL